MSTKNLLKDAELLVFPDFEKPFALITDASNTGIGFVLSQEHEGNLQPM